MINLAIGVFIGFFAGTILQNKLNKIAKYEICPFCKKPVKKCSNCGKEFY